MALENLERQSYRCFLPMAWNPNRRRCAPGSQPEALFSRYLFLNADPSMSNLSTVRSTRGVVGLVQAGLGLVSVPTRVVEALMARREGGLVRLDPPVIRPGGKARIYAGPLAGLEGIFQERCGERRAMLLLNLFGRKTTVEVDTLLLNGA